MIALSTPRPIIEAGVLRSGPHGIELHSGRRLVAVLHPESTARTIAEAVRAHFGAARLVMRGGAIAIEVTP